nr:MAG TPA: hypothetical protein [Herelleviridae sp.]
MKIAFEPMCQMTHHYKAWGNLRLFVCYRIQPVI